MHAQLRKYELFTTDKKMFIYLSLTTFYLFGFEKILLNNDYHKLIKL